MVTIRKNFGENPLKVAVLDKHVEFDTNGEATVDTEIAETLLNIPGYSRVVEDSEDVEIDGGSDEQDSEDEQQTPTQKRQPAARRPATKK